MKATRIMNAALAIALLASPMAMAKNNKNKGKKTDGKVSTNQVFRSLDTDRNKFITMAEWPRDAASFDRLDRNDDNRLSKSEFNRAAKNVRHDNNNGRFNGLDNNNDGMISRAEWRGNDRSFRNHDRNNDGFITAQEHRRFDHDDDDDDDRR